MAKVDVNELLSESRLPTGGLNTSKRHLSKLATQYRNGNVSKRSIDRAFGRPQDGGKWISRTWAARGVTS